MDFPHWGHWIAPTPLGATGCPHLDNGARDRMFGDMPQLLKIAADVTGLLPRHGQDVHIARVALARDSPLDTNDEWLLWLLFVVVFVGEPTQVVSDHALAEACPLSNLTFAGKSDTAFGGTAGEPQQHQLTGGLQVEVPNPGLNLVTHCGDQPSVVTATSAGTDWVDLKLGTATPSCGGSASAAQSLRQF